MDSDSINEKTLQDVHTKEIDLVNRDPKHLNDHVVKVRLLFISFYAKVHWELDRLQVLIFGLFKKPRKIFAR